MGDETRLLVERLTGSAAFTEPDDVRELTDGAEVSVAGLMFHHAPGHTPGSTMFQISDQGHPEIDSVVFPATSCLPARSAELTCQVEIWPTC